MLNKQTKAELIKDPILRAEYERIQADLRMQQQLRGTLTSLRAKSASKRKGRANATRRSQPVKNEK